MTPNNGSGGPQIVGWKSELALHCDNTAAPSKNGPGQSYGRQTPSRPQIDVLEARANLGKNGGKRTISFSSVLVTVFSSFLFQVEIHCNITHFYKKIK